MFKTRLEKKTLVSGARCRPEATGVVDLLQVLEGATYAAFIVGAIVAVYELRDLKRNRELEVGLRIADSWMNREFVGATLKLMKAEYTTAKELQDQSLEVDAKLVADLYDWYAGMIRDGRIDHASVYLDFATCYKGLEPWIVWWEKEMAPDRYESLRWAAGEAPKWDAEYQKKQRRTRK